MAKTAYRFIFLEPAVEGDAYRLVRDIVEFSCSLTQARRDVGKYVGPLTGLEYRIERLSDHGGLAVGWNKVDQIEAGLWA